MVVCLLMYACWVCLSSRLTGKLSKSYECIKSILNPAKLEDHCPVDNSTKNFDSWENA